MANTVHGPFVKGASTATGAYGTGVGQVNTYTSGDANNDETQSAVALASFNPDLITAAFILSGVACVKDATTASQLNITSGEAYVLMTDGTYARIDVVATSQSSGGHPSSTLYLYLQPDGSWYWSTVNSPAANSLAICTVTTDGSSNISAVTDARVMLAQALTGAAHPSAAQPGGVALPGPLKGVFTQNASVPAQVNGGVTFGQVGALRGSFDTAATFNGTTGYLLGPSVGLPTGNAAFTLEGWFKTSTTAANQFIAALGGTTSKTAGLLYINTSNQLVGDLFSSSIHSTATVTNGAWHHGVFTWDGTNGNLYLDGALVAGPTALGPNAMTSASLYVGAQNTGSVLNWFSGQLDEVAVYSAALAAARVTAHYTAGISATSDAYAATVLSDAPLRYHRLGDGVGATSAASMQAPVTVTLANADGTLQVGGIGGQVVAPGSLGAPVIVAQTVDQHITATTATTLLSFTAPVSGLYRANLYVLVSGSGNPSTLTAKATFTDRNGGPQTSFFTIQTFTAGATNPATLNSASVATANCISAFPIMGYVKAGGTCQIIYQNATATPNDFASAMIERLS